MVSKRTLLNLIEKTEESYKKLFNSLDRMKRADKVAVEPTDILDFQPNLAHCLFELDKLYRQLHQEQQRIIHRRNKTSNEWFIHRLKTINIYKEALRRTMFVGKALGDSFAWPFYSQNRELIDKHLAKEKQFHTPPGIGGLGERAFVESISFHYFGQILKKESRHASLKV